MKANVGCRNSLRSFIVRMVRRRCVVLAGCAGQLLLAMSVLAGPPVVSLIHSLPANSPIFGPMLLSGSTLYGTCETYDSFAGIVFKVGTDGTSFHPLHTF